MCRADAKKTKGAKETPSLMTQLFRKAFVTLVVALVANVMYVATVRIVCPPPESSSSPVVMSCPTTITPPAIQKKPWQFWKKEEHVPQVVEEPEEQKADEQSSFCQAAWSAMEWFPRLPGIMGESRPVVVEQQDCPGVEQGTQKKKKNPFQKLASKFKRRNKKKASPKYDLSQYAKAFSSTTGDFNLSAEQTELVKKLAVQIREKVPHLHSRLHDVAWGGPGGPRWWHPTSSHPQRGFEGLDGGRLLASYLQIMHWPKDLWAHFPFKLCSEGCDSADALVHTLEFREKYKPWMMTPSAIAENHDGFAYHRGHSPSLTGDNSGHAVVWFRAGMHHVLDPDAYWRTVLNTIDMAIADNLKRSHDKVGRFNVVIDGAHFKFSMMPSIHEVKRGVLMLQDHFPDRLGMVFVANMSRVGELLFNLVVRVISKEVRAKIQLLPHDPEKRLAVLETVVEKQYVPDYFGGEDTYRFDAATYYPPHVHWTEKEGHEYLKTMPYHA